MAEIAVARGAHKFVLSGSLRSGSRRRRTAAIINQMIGRGRERSRKVGLSLVEIDEAAVCVHLSAKRSEWAEDIARGLGQLELKKERALSGDNATANSSRPAYRNGAVPHRC